MIDLSKHSIAQLRELQSQIEEQIKLRQRSEVGKAKQQIIAIAESVGMTVIEIMGKKETKAVAAQYRNPEDPTQQWSGRGRQPLWIKDYLGRTGKAMDDLKIA